MITLKITEKCILEKMGEISKGDEFVIFSTNDEDVNNWYSGEILVAQNVEIDTNGVWVKDCPFRIDMDEITVKNYIGFREYLYSTDYDNFDDAVVDYIQNFDSNKIHNSNDYFEEECLDSTVVKIELF